MSSLRKTSTTAEEKKEQEQESQTTGSEAELKEQFAKLNEEVKQLKEKNNELLVSSFSNEMLLCKNSNYDSYRINIKDRWRMARI